MNKTTKDVKSWAVVTGASSGIGRELAILLAADGYNVVLSSRDKTELESLATQLRKTYFVQAKVYDGDLSKQLVVRGLYDYCVKSNLKVGCLINAAGFGDYSPLLSADWRRLKNMMQLNILSLVELTYLFAGDMAKRGGGKIMNIASTAAFLSGPRMATYYASKAFVLHFSEAVDLEMRPAGIEITTLCPGPTQSKFADSAHANNMKIFKSKLPTSAVVARFGYNAMGRGGGVVVHGWRNRLVVFLIRFGSRKQVVRFVNKVQS